jgi:alpha-galactosidase
VFRSRAHANGLLLPLFGLISLVTLAAQAQSEPTYKRTEEVIYGQKFGTSLTLDVFQPVPANGYGVIFLVSGGWLSSRDTPNMVTINVDSIKLFLNAGYTVFAVVHGSQPKFTIPEIVQDLHRAVRFVRHNAAVYGVKPDRLGITGSSSGGHLALMIATQGGKGNADAPDPVERESSAVQAAAVFFPPTDFLNWGAPGVDAVGVGTLARLKAAFGPRADTAAERQIYGKEISPAYFVTSNLPPAVIIHGDADPVVPMQQAQLFIQRAREAGAMLPKLVVRPGKGHGWDKFWESKEDIQVFTDWFDRYLRDAAKPLSTWLPETQWTAPALPVRFRYGGLDSAEFLRRCLVSEEPPAATPRGLRHLVLDDPVTQLRLTAEIRTIAGFDALEWVLFFENRGAQDTPILEEIQAGAFALPAPKAGDYTLHFADGSSEKITDFQPRELQLTPGIHLSLGPVGGRSSDGVMPFFNLASPEGGGLFFAVGWSGQWAASFARVEDGRVMVRAGMEKTHLRLHPAERIRTPAILLMRYRGDTVAGHNQFRRLMLEDYTPHPDGKELEPVVAASGAVVGFNNVSETNQIQAVANIAAHKLPVNYYWIDAGWSRGGFAEGMGNWDPDPARFPRGLKPVADKVHEAGLKFLMWFEPERVMPGTWLRTQHPEWLLAPANLPAPMAYQHDWRLLNQGNPEALAWLKGTFGGYIRELGLGVYRLDFNLHPLYYWRSGEAEDRQGINEIGHITGLYDYLDFFRRENPGLLLDDCASGGRRIDFEMMRRTVPLLRSDYLWDPVGAQCFTWALSLWVPVSGHGGVSTAPYDFRSGMQTCVAYAFDFYNKDAPFWEPLAQRLKEFRQVQPCFSRDFYPLTQYTTSADRWMAWQFDVPESAKGLVQAFRRASNNVPSLTFKLRGLAPKATYAIHDFDGSGSVKATGSELMEKGLLVQIPSAPGAALFTYAKCDK